MLEVQDLVVRFGAVTAVDGVSLGIPAGPSGVGLVGESGSGKTTIARAVLGLVEPAGGDVVLDGVPITALRGRRRQPVRRRLQAVPQDPDGTLDPRMRIGPTLEEVLRAHRVVPRGRTAARAEELLREVELESEHARRFPHQLSGGQRQRVSISRALAVGPDFVVLDKPTSALDVTVQAVIIDLLRRLKDERGLAFLLISHNLAVVADLCETVNVLYLGRIVETGPTRLVLGQAAHPYTIALRSAVSDVRVRPTRERIVLSGPPGDPAHPPTGCRFHPRCPVAISVCAVEPPPLRSVAGRSVACHRAEEVVAGGLTALNGTPV
jgi:peptide/nickel transport system ATP-binding protein